MDALKRAEQKLSDQTAQTARLKIELARESEARFEAEQRIRKARQELVIVERGLEASDPDKGGGA